MKPLLKFPSALAAILLPFASCVLAAHEASIVNGLSDKRNLLFAEVVPEHVDYTRPYRLKIARYASAESSEPLKTMEYRHQYPGWDSPLECGQWLLLAFEHDPGYRRNFVVTTAEGAPVAKLSYLYGKKIEINPAGPPHRLTYRGVFTVEGQVAAGYEVVVTPGRHLKVVIQDSKAAPAALAEEAKAPATASEG